MVEQCCEVALAQVIRIVWSKASRGGLGAIRRNAIPIAQPIPAFAGEGRHGSIVMQQLTWSERNQFAQPMLLQELLDRHEQGCQIGCINLLLVEHGIDVRFVHDMERGGLPDRWYLNLPRKRGESAGMRTDVPFGRWMRIRYNGRYTDRDSGHWWYEEYTINLIPFFKSPHDRIFLDTKPLHDWDFRSVLR